MAQVYNNHLPPDNILNLVNERLLKPTDQKRTSKLENYFLGYKEYLETPPSPTLSEPDQLFSYLDGSCTNLDEVPYDRRAPPKNPLEVESQANCGKTNTSINFKNNSERRKGNQKTERRGGRVCKRSKTFKAGIIVNENSQSIHHMETRSRTAQKASITRARQTKNGDNSSTPG